MLFFRHPPLPSPPPKKTISKQTNKQTNKQKTLKTRQTNKQQKKNTINTNNLGKEKNTFLNPKENVPTYSKSWVDLHPSSLSPQPPLPLSLSQIPKIPTLIARSFRFRFLHHQINNHDHNWRSKRREGQERGGSWS